MAELSIAHLLGASLQNARPRSSPAPIGPQRLNAAGSLYLTRLLRTHFDRTYDEFGWRANELFDAVAGSRITITVGGRYPLEDAAQAHRDLQVRKTHGSTVLTP